MEKLTPEEIKKNLEENLPPVISAAQAPVAIPQPIKDEKDIDDDYEFSRKTYRDLVDKSNHAIDSMMELATNSEHPRAFEVLSTMLKNTSDMTQKLMDLQKDKKAIKKKTEEKAQATTTTNNNLFVGSTSDLQKHLLAKLSTDGVTDVH